MPSWMRSAAARSKCPPQSCNRRDSAMRQALLRHPAFEPSHFDTAESVPLESRAPDEKARRERRAATRHSEGRLDWGRAARLQFGPGVSLVDLSTGGALLESPVVLRPGSVFSLQITGAGPETPGPFRVLGWWAGGPSSEGRP